MIDLVRRDPSSPAFIDLAEAYLALGRPKDAATVGRTGLESSPDNLEGRVTLARAYCAMHQWKEAQGELLRVVKVDRSNRLGFALLGEVLLRRNDYERAVPVLQHAQNLDPTSPQILNMLKRARGNQPLDPPPPVPQPVPPRGETNYGISLEDAAPSARSGGYAPSSPVAPTMAIKPTGDTRGDPTDYQPQPYGSYGEAPSQSRSQKKVTAPPPMSVEGVRPRVVATSKPTNAAAASLRQSAAVGENYLNDLLTGGLLDVAGVRVPDSDFDLRPDRRWGRSTRRAFIFLFVVLVLGIGGGGTWYWWTEKQKSEAVARLQTESQQSIGNGDFDGLETSLKKLADALEKDKSNLLTFAYVVQTAGLESLLYGTDTGRVDQAIKAVAKDIKPGDAGSRELVIGKAAVELSRLSQLQAPASTLAEVRKSLDDFLAKHENDKWARWLKARAMLAAGERKEAQAVLKVAGEGEDGLVVAMVDQADLLVDEGKLDEALKLYDAALKKSKDHPLAVLGRALALAESTVDSNAAIDDLSVKLDPKTKNVGPRVTAYRNLALALAKANIEDYTGSAEALKAATANKPPNEPRFWARVAWAHYIRGELPQAATARGKIAWFGKKDAEDDPAVMLADAALLLASGLPDKVLETASKIEGIRPRLLRVYAELDNGKAKDAIENCNWILERAKENVETQILKEQAKMMLGPAKETTAASDALEKLAKKTKSKIARHAMGMAYFANGDLKNAQPALETAVKELGEESPNPLQYRTRTVLAEIYLAAGNITDAGKQLDEALKVNSGYFPTRVLQAKVVLRNNEPDRALNLLVPIRKEFTSPEVDLLTIEAGCSSKKTTAKEKDEAKAALAKMKDQPGVDAAELSRVATVCDPDLPKQLGLPEPGKAAEVKKPAKSSSSSKRRRK